MSKLKQAVDQLEQRMKSHIAAVNVLKSDIPAIGNTLSTLRTIIADLRIAVVKHQFSGIDEEVEFFKAIKPVFLAQYFYHKTALSLRIAASFKTVDQQKYVFTKELDRIHRFIQKNHAFYRYCISSATGMDNIYFTRGKVNAGASDADPEFSTTHDRKLARFIAAELLKPFLFRNIEQQAGGVAPSGLRWTGSKTDLTELIYALQTAGVFNDGESDIKQIAHAFESLANIDLGDYYRTFQSIQVRKTNQLAFLSKLTERLQGRLNDISG